MFVKYVKEFMNATEQTVDVYNKKQVELYEGLIEEESKELYSAMVAGNRVEILDGCCDLIWVTIGYEFSEGFIDSSKYKFTITKDDNFDMSSTIQKLRDRSLFKVNLHDSVLDVIQIALHYNLDIIGGFKEVHRSNMSKVDPSTGKVIRREGDGKILKPASYSKPDLTPFVS